MVMQAFKYELDPTAEQRILLARACGTARFVYNWALADRIRCYEQNEGSDRFVSFFDQGVIWTQEKPEWSSELSRWVATHAIQDLGFAFDNFVKGRKAGRNVGFPRFKSRGKCRPSFRVRGASFPIRDDFYVRLPVLGKASPFHSSVAWFRSKERLRIKGRVKFATVSLRADRWFVSFVVDRHRESPGPRDGAAIGIDLGISQCIVTSDGVRYDAPMPLRTSLELLQRRSRQHSRKQKGSANRRKSAMVLAKLHARISNIRSAWIHEVTTELVKQHCVVVVESLNVKGMVRNRHLARALSDVSFGEILRQLQYKSEWYGSRVIKIDTWFPSSKLCSGCGHKKEELALSERVYSCLGCGLELDRDLNAARNILAEGLRLMDECDE